jgi:glycosyltransferase involved in cell wall biosynthesis
VTPLLFSFCVLAYNNYRYIFETLDSLFLQDYPEIELVVSNDGSTDFDEKEVRRYIAANSRENIRSVLIQNHPVNQGTVRNAEWCRTHAHGEYLMYMAADDALNHPQVLSSFAAAFDRLGPEATILCGRTEMCGGSLNDGKGSIPSEAEIALIKSGDSRRLFSFLSHDYIIPTTGVCCRAAVYSRTGGYDLGYRLIEDYSFFARAARMGIPFFWLDGPPVSRHRDGGVSHGNVSGAAASLEAYHRDEKLLFEREFLPYADLLLPEDRKRFHRKLRVVRGRYLAFHGYRELPFAQMLRQLPVCLFFRLRERLKRPAYFLRGLFLGKR